MSLLYIKTKSLIIRRHICIKTNLLDTQIIKNIVVLRMSKQCIINILFKV